MKTKGSNSNYIPSLLLDVWTCPQTVPWSVVQRDRGSYQRLALEEDPIERRHTV